MKKYALILHLAICIQYQSLSQVKVDTVITISDTLIRTDEDTIVIRGRGEDNKDILTKQRDTTFRRFERVEKMFEKDTSKKIKVFGYPIIGYVPETNWIFGGGAQIYFRQKKVPENNLSFFRTGGKYTLNKQYLLFSEYGIYLLKENKIWIVGKFDYHHWLEEFYGIGNKTEYTNREIIKYQVLYSDIRVLYGRKKIYLGPQVRFSKLFSTEYPADSSLLATTDITGKNGYQTIGIGLALIADTRDNIFFPFKGYYIACSNYIHPNLFSERQFEFYNLEIDYRQFFNPMKGKHVLALRGYVSVNLGAPPFRLLSLHGGQFFGRGYYEGRYRDRHLWLTQLEWRFPIFWRFRGTAFGSLGDVAHLAQDWSFQTIKWGLGVGIRHILDPKERFSIRFDYAHGKSKNDQGFYFSFQEVF